MKITITVLSSLIFFIACKKDQHLSQMFITQCDTVRFVGDSQFAETGGDLIPPPRRYYLALGKSPGTVENVSIGGATSTTMANLNATKSSLVNYSVVAMLGTNNSWEDSTIIADLHRVVDGHPYLICEVQSGSGPDCYKGTVRYTHDSLLNVRIAVEFGARNIIKIKEGLQKLADGSVEDSLDLVHDVVPRSCLYDWKNGDMIHKNNKGHEGITNMILEKIISCNNNSARWKS